MTPNRNRWYPVLALAAFASSGCDRLLHGMWESRLTAFEADIIAKTTHSMLYQFGALYRDKPWFELCPDDYFVNAEWMYHQQGYNYNDDLLNPFEGDEYYFHEFGGCWVGGLEQYAQQFTDLDPFGPSFLPGSIIQSAFFPVEAFPEEWQASLEREYMDKTFGGVDDPPSSSVVDVWRGDLTNSLEAVYGCTPSSGMPKMFPTPDADGNLELDGWFTPDDQCAGTRIIKLDGDGPGYSGGFNPGPWGLRNWQIQFDQVHWEPEALLPTRGTLRFAKGMLDESESRTPESTAANSAVDNGYDWDTADTPTAGTFGPDGQAYTLQITGNSDSVWFSIAADRGSESPIVLRFPQVMQ
jgi:hypothetical protein